MTTDTTLLLPLTLDDISVEWLSAFLSRGAPGTEVAKVTIRDRHDGTAARLALEVDYVPGHDNGLPRHLFVKSLIADPIAPRSMYECEVNFFRTMRPRLTLETPRIAGVEANEAESHFCLVMEDVTARGARMGHPARPYSADEMASILDTEAELHATWWGSPEIDVLFPWLETHLTGPNADFFRTGCPAVMESEYSASAYKKKYFDPDGFYTPERLWKSLWTLQEINEAQVPTVLHGDAHVGNSYAIPGGRGGLIDWQLMRKGCWAHDVTYSLCGMAAEDRRHHEKDLLRGYMAGMERRGVSVGDWDEVWLRHRQNAVWGAVMWMSTPTLLYDEERLSLMIERHRVAMDDLETVAALGCD